MIVDSLATERHVQFSPKRVLRDFEDLVAWLREAQLDKDPVVRHHLARLAVEVAEVQALSLDMLQAVQDGRAAVVEAASNKLCRQRGLPAHRPPGDGARCSRSVGARDPDRVPLAPDDQSETIGGGTSEIMRGLIARNALGLGAKR